jgi:hypothetical protein
MIEKWCCDRPIVVSSEVEVTAATGHIPACERRIKSFRAFQLRRGSLRETGSIDAEAFLMERRQRGNSMAGVCGGLQSVSWV